MAGDAHNKLSSIRRSHAFGRGGKFQYSNLFCKPPSWFHGGHSSGSLSEWNWDSLKHLFVSHISPFAFRSQWWMNFQPLTWLPQHLACLKRAVAKNKLSRRHCAGKQEPRQKSLPPPKVTSSADVPASEPCGASQEAGCWLCKTISSTLLAMDLSAVIPPCSLLMPGPVFACLASKDKLQALRRPDFRHLNRVWAEGREDKT